MADSESPYDHRLTMQTMRMAFQPFAAIANMVTEEDVKIARDVVSRAESVGFLADPTRYREAVSNGSLERQRRLIDLFERTKQALQEIFPDGWAPENGR